MADFETLKFDIPAYTPETMPLDRLIEYLQQISAVLGASQDLHLIRVENGSTRPVFKLPATVAVRARENAAEVRQGGGSVEQRKAFERVRRMVRRDTRDVGTKPARLRDGRRVLLEFPVVTGDASSPLGLTQPTSIDGALVRVGGVGEQVTLQLQKLSGETLSGFVATKSLAKQMAPRIFEPIRLHGIGVWERSSEGVWTLARMQVQSYEPLEDESLNDVVAKLRGAPVTWPDDADERLRAEREGSL